MTDEPEKRRQVAEWISDLNSVSAELRERIVTAWVSAWAASSFGELNEIPYSPHAPDYRLADHVNDVIRVGMDLMRRAQQDWGVKIEAERLLPVLALHDVDKPLMFERREGRVQYAPIFHEIPHGILGAMILNDLGFEHAVVSAVALHSPSQPYHGRSIEAYILHYADMFCTDRAYMLAGIQPFYQKKLVM